MKWNSLIYKFIFRYISGVILLLLVCPVGRFGAIAVRPVMAMTTCTADISPSSITISSSGSFNVSVRNDDPDDSLDWIYVAPPAGLTPDGISLIGWSTQEYQSGYLITDDNLGGGETLSMTVQVTADGTVRDSANWTVEAANDSTGDDRITCDGGLGTAIVDPDADTEAPVISNILVSEVLDSSVIISWTTDENADSLIQYGVTDSLGSEKSAATLTTSHSMTLTGLSSNTTYYYNILSSDADSNQSESGENSFVTAKSGVTGATVTGSVTTVTRTVTPIPTPTPTPDISPPRVSLSQTLAASYQTAPTFTGTASDVAGVESVEYSLDAGRNFMPVDTLTKPGAKSVVFSFTPDRLLDDTYELYLRSTDLKGNTGKTKVGLLTIDRLPPQVGGAVFTVGSQEITDGRDGIPTAISGQDVRITLDTSGGPTEINLFLTGQDGVGSRTSLAKVEGTGLWSGLISLKQPGVYGIEAASVDGASNRTVRALGVIRIVAGGMVRSAGSLPVSGARIEVLVREPVANRFVPWDAAALDQVNPVLTGEDGRYGLYLPAGTYVLRISAPGKVDGLTGIFSLETGSPLQADFTLADRAVLNLGSWRLSLPSWGSQLLPVPIADVAESVRHPLLGQSFPQFLLRDGDRQFTDLTLRGQDYTVCIMNSWIPQFSYQLAQYQEAGVSSDREFLIILPHQSDAGVALMKKRGLYDLTMLADPDGTLIVPLSLYVMPMHLSVDRNGIVTGINQGLLSGGDLVNNGSM